MTGGALDIALTRNGPRIRPPAPLGIEAMLVGRSREEAAELLPRLFNLCRATQSLGARRALGLELRRADEAELARDIMREHLMRLFVLWPRRLGLAPAPLPGPDATLASAFGASRRLPDPDELDRWLASGDGVAPLFRAISEAFAPGEAVADLPAPDPQTLCQTVAQENSPWARHRDAPLLAAAEARFGRGPLWRALARLVDLDACARGSLDTGAQSANGITFVPAARGTYALSARIREGRVVAFSRWTPTDHLLAPDGALTRSLAALPAAKAHFAPLAVDILDPCMPVLFREEHHA